MHKDEWIRKQISQGMLTAQLRIIQVHVNALQTVTDIYMYNMYMYSSSRRTYTTRNRVRQVFQTAIEVNLCIMSREGTL